MAFTVEDGTGLADANAYISVDAFKEYHDDRGGDYSSYSDEQIQQGIVRATDYIERRFGARFVGSRETATQSLSWPRQYAYYKDLREALLVPLPVQQATAEYGLRALAATLAPDPDYDGTNGKVVEREERAGPIVERYKFGQGGVIYTFRKYPLADAILSELTYSPGYLLRV